MTVRMHVRAYGADGYSSVSCDLRKEIMELIDLHCHLVPYVDDGAEDMGEALGLLRILHDQGVKAVCATPHLRAHMFQTPDGEIRQRFAELQEAAEKENIPIRLYLSREYHCDRDFFGLLENKKLLPIGNGNSILCEFSGASEASFILKTVKDVIRNGYLPLVAHVERYAAVHQNKDLIGEIKSLGGLIQVNAGSITGDEGFSLKHFSRKLAKEKRIDVVASDSHDPVNRPPFLLKCAQWLEQKAGAAYARKVLYETPLTLLSES